MDQTQINKRYDWYARIYDVGPFNWLFEKMFFSKWRARILGNLKGKILEVGVGTGLSFQYYNYASAHVTAVDTSSKMLEKANHRSIVDKYPVHLKQVKDKLPFKDDTFDYVITFCVLCSVANPIATLQEMARVCKPKGELIMVEHMLSNNKIIAFLEKIHNPITKYIWGYNINRDTPKNIEKAGLKITKSKNLALHDVFREIHAVKDKIIIR
ncbi:MAG: hypothetical protein A2730_03715 [Candidatus Staskawiczbacteria bacterium RIFCSPHIGHO2_01_FULL_39_25]|uniref:Methyltransferase type 11 domain-containing protein n=1 Tax=Candidatus Staskawiczbacteria bacterium RIFCSPHIGHO2_01_FULL_39_25 TaxID=1802202 RepID=A0A1G2HQT3_9BACT|nr:MAG: hypothetical protein A2730_03715 [Candidatus Staskawiczbacteria bacterium RIFCSPHIGHO2_01_FULL_39_25]